VQVTHQLSDGAAPVLSMVHVGGQTLSQMRHPVQQWITERSNEADAKEPRRDRHQCNRKAAPANSPTRKQHHERVEQKRDKTCHNDQQHDVAQPVQELAAQICRGHNGDCRKDGR
jgi:hypothetical protein